MPLRLPDFFCWGSLGGKVARASQPGPPLEGDRPGHDRRMGYRPVFAESLHDSFPLVVLKYQPLVPSPGAGSAVP